MQMKSLMIGCLMVAACAAAAVEIPADLASCTNYATCPQALRNKFRQALVESAKAGDFAKVAALTDVLAKSPTTGATYDLWAAGADALVDAGLAQKKKKPEEQKALMAGFREGGTTFGLWQGGGDEVKTPDQAFVAAARNLVERKMPQAALDPEVQVRKAQTLLGFERKTGTDATRRAAAAALDGLAFAIEPKTQSDTNAFLNAASAYLGYLFENDKFAAYADFARTFRTKRAALLSPVEKSRWFAREIGGLNRADDEKAYLKLAAEFRKQPVDLVYLEGLFAFKDVVTRCFPQRWKAVLELGGPLVSRRRQLFKGNQLLRVDEFLVLMASGLGDVALMKEIYGEMLTVQAGIEKAWEAENVREKAAREAEKVARQNKQAVVPFVRNKDIERPQPWNVNNARGIICREMPKYAEWAFVAPEMAKGLNPRNPNGYLDLVKAYVLAGETAKAREIAAQVTGTNTTANADQKFLAAAMVAWIEAKDAKSLAANLSKLRGEMDDKAWFNALRKAGRIYFGFDSSEKRTDWLKAVIAMSRNLLWPEERVEYEVKWLEDAPRSAEAAYRGDVFKTLRTENRMALYNCYSLFDKPNEEKLLKSNPKPHLAADAEGKEAAVCAAYDAWGLHVYMRFNDPEAEKAKDGIANGFYCEYDFQPGGETPWHWNMITRADQANVDQGAVWDSPRKGFKVGAEYIVEDAFSAKDCHVFHVYIPWILCWNEFPKDGDVWRMVVVAGWAGQFGAMGGGAVHELGRGMHLKFDIPKAVRAKMTRKLLREAVTDYRKVRDKWENASFWADPDLGDPEFNDAVAKPFIAACDKLAEECSSDALTDGRAAEILATNLGDLADFRLALDRKRAEWLKANFFAK